MPWVEIFIVFVVSHLVGDFLLQTEFQATNKRGGLGPDPVRRRALLSHGLTYTLAFVPCYIWLADDLGAGVILLALLVSVPHVIQDDGRLVSAWSVKMKKVDSTDTSLGVAIDQSFHVVALLLTAFVAGG